MLFTIGVMAIAVSLEPFRIGMTVLMLNRPRPLMQLLAFLTGGFAMGLTVGATALFLFRRVLLRSTYFTLPRVQILIGALALVAAAGLAAKIVADRRRGTRHVPPDGDGAGPAWLRTRARRLLDGRSLWVAAAAGLGIALPSVDYLAALAVILASGAPVMTQLGALLMFNVIAFSLVEIPVVAYLLAPTATRAAMTALQDWIRSRRRIEVAALLAAVGLVLLVVGLAEL
ncbi:MULTISPECIES: GAP family protein [Mycobacterium]|uniref:GAP family protein n=1 Tax=Mycobacterium TaxID=1763 RepID=UPI001CD9F297|nr:MULTISPECIES: GAP family protein [Mycobacterium]MCA2242624.1 GAP family protein [Mycobacterium sp. WUMAC-067]MCA2316914.1 GAP family protein [Mycobacterium sp. WUMAC-025]MEE3753531.1 GAP family protein [Mycobacterium intracellulare]